MKIGIFDSGLGGLVVLKELKRKLPKYDYLYLGDTKNLPYGDKSQAKIFDLTKKAVAYLFQQDCELVIVACNTASSQALRRLQQEYLPKSEFKSRKILGIIRPTVEEVENFQNIGIIGTTRTIDSKSYLRELKKINPQLKIIQEATPQLVPMIEAGRLDQQILSSYLKPFQNTQALILGCTHYGLIKKDIRQIYKGKLIAQEELLPGKLAAYLKRHPALAKKLSRNSQLILAITKTNPRYQQLAEKWFGRVKLATVKTK